MKLLVSIAAVMMVAGAFAAERCGCNKPNINKPKHTAATPAPKPVRQCAPAKPCAQRPVTK